MTWFRRQDPLTEASFDAMVSLGKGCRPAYQIARSHLRRSAPELTLDQINRAVWRRERTAFPRGAFFFDWLITPFPALIRCIAEDFAGVFDRSALAVAEHGLVANRDEIVFFHAFPKGADGRVEPESLDALYPKLRAKFDHLAAKTLRVFMGRRRVLYIRAGADPREAGLIANAIARRHPRHRFHVLQFVETAAPKGFLVRGRRASVVEVDSRVDKPREREWQGNDEAWGAILDRIRIDGREPGAAPADRPAAAE